MKAEMRTHSQKRNRDPYFAFPHTYAKKVCVRGIFCDCNASWDSKFNNAGSQVPITMRNI